MNLSILWASTHTAVSVYPHTHSFYQLIFCKKSGGYIRIGGALYPAQEHNVYLSKPGSCHSIDQCNMLEILEIKFNAAGIMAQRIDQLPDQFSLQNTPITEAFLDRVCLELNRKDPCFDSAATNALELFFIDAFRYFGVVTHQSICAQNDTDCQNTSRENGDLQILQLKDYIDAHMHENLTLEQLAKLAHFNKTYFVQRFKELWGVPPMKYVSNMRCQKARYLLIETDLSVSEISAITGFQSPHYFSSVFKKYTGISPNDFRKREKPAETPITRGNL